jgi:VanZ family protein
VKLVVRIGARLCILAIVALSIVPPDYRITTDLPCPVEHFSIFLITGLAFGVAYRHRYVVQVVYLILFAGIVELTQLEIPGRHARLSDFVASALGVSVAYLLLTLIARRERQADGG